MTESIYAIRNNHWTYVLVQPTTYKIHLLDDKRRGAAKRWRPLVSKLKGQVSEGSWSRDIKIPFGTPEAALLFDMIYLEEIASDQPKPKGGHRDNARLLTNLFLEGPSFWCSRDTPYPSALIADEFNHFLGARVVKDSVDGAAITLVDLSGEGYEQGQQWVQQQALMHTAQQLQAAQDQLEVALAARERVLKLDWRQLNLYTVTKQDF